MTLCMSLPFGTTTACELPKRVTLYVTGFTKTIPIGTRNEIQFIADY